MHFQTIVNSFSLSLDSNSVSSFTMQFLVVILFVATLCPWPLVNGDAVAAQEKCKSIHHVDVDLKDTLYLNQKCLLNCNIHGKIWSHFMNEQLHCDDGASSGVSTSGLKLAKQNSSNLYTLDLSKWFVCNSNTSSQPNPCPQSKKRTWTH